ADRHGRELDHAGDDGHAREQGAALAGPEGVPGVVMVRPRSPAAVVVGKLAPALSLLVAVLFFLAIAPRQPPDQGQVRTILVQTVIVALAALGMTLVIVSGGIDLSVGSAVALSSVIAARVTETLWSGAAGAMQPYVAILAGVATGAACGLYSGLLIVLL